MGEIRALRDQGQAAWDAGQWELAQAAYGAIIEVDPADRLASRRFLESLREVGVRGRADESAVRLVELLEQRGDIAGATDLIEATLEVFGDSCLALRCCYRLHFSQANSEAGLARLRQLSDLYLERKDFDAAVATLREAQEAFPEQIEIGMELGHLLIALGRVDEGAEQFRNLGHRALDSNIEDAMEAFRRWDFLQRLGQLPG